MPTWQTIVLLAMAGLATGSLLFICRAIQKSAKSIHDVCAELQKINDKLERVDAVSGEDTSLEAVEAAFSSFEKLKRIDTTQEIQGKRPVPAKASNSSPPPIFSSYR